MKIVSMHYSWLALFSIYSGLLAQSVSSFFLLSFLRHSFLASLVTNSMSYSISDET